MSRPPSLTSPEDLTAFLNALAVRWRMVEHPPVFRVGEGEDLKAALPGAHTKNLFLKDKAGEAWLVCADQASAIDLKRLPAAIGSGRLSFAAPALMDELLGVTPGSVTVFALANDADRRVRLVLDRRLAEAKFVNFHPLANTATLGIDRLGLRRFLAAVGTSPIIVDFAHPAGPTRADCAWAAGEPS